MNAIESRLSSPRFQRYLLWLGVVVLAAGALALTVTLVGGNDKTHVNPDKGFHAQLPETAVPLKNSSGVTIKTYAQLDDRIRADVKTFIATVVAREHLDRGWNVVAPSLRAGYTKKQWTAGENLPVVPYPGVDPQNVQYFLDYASTREILLEVGVSGKPGVTTRPVTFQLGLVPTGTKAHRWVVDYWMPRWTPPVPQGG